MAGKTRAAFRIVLFFNAFLFVGIFLLIRDGTFNEICTVKKEAIPNISLEEAPATFLNDTVLRRHGADEGDPSRSTLHHREEGVLWIWFMERNSPREHFRELLLSAWSVRANSRTERGEREDFHTTLLCDKAVYALIEPFHNATSHIINNVTVIDPGEYISRRFPDRGGKSGNDVSLSYKALVGLLTPYRKTLFLDLDVLVVGDRYVRTMLNYVSGPMGFDLVQTQVWANRNGPFTYGIPVGCTCAMSFRDSDPSRLVMDAWMNLTFDRNGAASGATQLPPYAHRDQEVLWWVLRTRRPPDLKYFQLPPEYNCMLSQSVEDKWTYRTKFPDVNGYSPGKPFNEVPCMSIHSHGMLNALKTHYCVDGPLNSKTYGYLSNPMRHFEAEDICALERTLELMDPEMISKP